MAKQNQKNSLLFIVAVVAVAIALANLGVTVYKLGGLKKLTGYASEDTDTATANITIVSQASINFTTNNINWGSGAVTAGQESATLDSEGTVTGGNWTTVSAGLTLQNDGNTNVSVTLQTSNINSTFIGGTDPQYNLKVSNNESDSCLSIDMSSYTPATGNADTACSNFGFNDSIDSINIDVELVVPRDAVPGAKGSVITAAATPL